MLGQSNRPFLPSQLQNPMMGGMSFPIGGGNKMPEKPNPLSQAPPTSPVFANASGIQQAMAKRGGLTLKGMPKRANRIDDLVGPGRISSTGRGALVGLGAGGLIGGAMGLVGDPGEDKEGNERSRLSSVLNKAMAVGSAGAVGGTLGGFAFPDKTAAQDSSATRLSSTGSKSGVTYRVSDDGNTTGSAAFDTLDGYMKKAGLNSFQAQFFTGLLEKGLNEAQINECVKTASDRFGDTVGSELTDGLEKMAVGLGLGLKGAWNLGKGLLGKGIPAAAKAAPAVAAKATRAAKASPAVGQVLDTGAARSAANFGKGLGPAAAKAAPAASKASPAAGKVVDHGAAGAASGFGRNVFSPTRQAFRTSRQAVNAAPRATYDAAGRAVGATANTARRASGATANTAGRAAGATANTARRASGAVKNTFTARAGNHMGTGAVSGAFNPYTGLGSGNIRDDEGFHGDRLLASVLGGAALGRVGGNAGKNMMQRGLVGESGGYIGGRGANYIGNKIGDETLQNVDPRTLARLGYGAGALSATPGLGKNLKRVPGVNKIPGIGSIGSRKSTRWLADHEPVHAVGKRVGKAKDWAKANPNGAMIGGSILASSGGLAHVINSGKKDMQEQFQKYREEYGPKVDQALEDASQASEGVKDMSGKVTGVTDKVNDLLGGGGPDGEGGWWQNILGSFGGVGTGVVNFVTENPWLQKLLLPALLGVGGGYALGGRSGAMLGGVGLTTLAALLSNHEGGPGSDEQNSESDQRTNEKTDAAIADRIQSGNIAEVPDTESQQNEIQRQREQQQAANQQLGPVQPQQPYPNLYGVPDYR